MSSGHRCICAAALVAAVTTGLFACESGTFRPQSNAASAAVSSAAPVSSKASISSAAPPSAAQSSSVSSVNPVVARIASAVQGSSSAGNSPPPAASKAASAAKASVGGYRAPAMETSPYHADAASGENGVFIDASSTSLGYVAVSATSAERLKFQVLHAGSTYNYDLPRDGTPTSYVLQTGSGSYTFRVMRNIAGTKYAQLYSVTKSVSLKSSLSPFLRPSQIVDYGKNSACVRKAAVLAASASDAPGVVANIYSYIRDHIRYDSAKAQTVQSGYLPDPDQTLSSGKGICFDYAALAAAMLRSQGISAKLMTGYVSPQNVYHAWNMIWLDESGWITVQIQAPSRSWERIDLTFAAGGYTGGASGYTDRYTY